MFPPYRASLKRGLAFSYSFKNPPLSKMGHVNSQSQQLQAEAGPSASKGDKTAAVAGPAVVPAGAGGQAGGQAAGAAGGAAGAAAGPTGLAAGPSTAPVAGPSTSSDKGEKEKKSKFISSSSFFSSGGWHSKLEG
ncbi:Golgi-associated RAB2B interactor protein 3-like isoform X2 [Ostrinia nubilalis]|uniref:Golgi-associated RAB2B interactor protein 3-like isoform X2 n=1 Tax=Ostrinia nubilalis TaxID=29057 RepID=UPI0030823D9F